MTKIQHPILAKKHCVKVWFYRRKLVFLPDINSRVMRLITIILLFYTFLWHANAQDSAKVITFQGEFSSTGQYAPTDHHYSLLGVRYIPQLNITIPSKSAHQIDFEFSVDMSAYYSFIDTTAAIPSEPNRALYGAYVNGGNTLSAKLMAYRLWARYQHQQFELRLGLQKIDFGSSTLLRPLQWFNTMDPRDPLKITNGVLGLLGRYYFKNSANIWLWCLTMNGAPRGMELLNTDPFLPELGGRFQFPIPKGELAFTYNHRWTDLSMFYPIVDVATSQQDKFALDGKWDIGIGIWLEATYSFLYPAFWDLTHQWALNIGLDYTFPVGSGLNVLAEHLIMSYDEKPFEGKNLQNMTALQISYPIAMFDNLSLIGYYSWEQQTVSAFLSYMHAFKKLTLFTNLYYNPKTENVKSQILNSYNNLQLGRGFGVQVMLVFNH